ncbi:hypothetical protein M1N62_06180 [Thermodesulfovibrionales bacterium]|nr:hypothetical protein [Thermodesulfovibrionales bacterium]
MKGGVDVRSFASLKELEVALGRFAGTTREVMHVVEREIRQTAEELEDRRREAERDLRYWQEAYETAENSEERSRAERKLEEVKESLRHLGYLRGLLIDQQQVYRRQASKLAELATDESIKARHFLKESLDQLQAYAVAQGLESSPSLGSPAAGGARVTAAYSGVEKEKNSLSNFPLPDGYRWVSLNDIDQNEILKDIKFEKTSSERMKAGFHTLKDEILPALKEDPTRDGWYFADRDREAGRQYPDGQQRVYDAFFGQDHIRLERWEGDPYYGITNGRHRILITRELGWRSIPAKTIDVPRKR